VHISYTQLNPNLTENLEVGMEINLRPMSSVVLAAPIGTILVTNERMNQSISELLCQSFSKPSWSLGSILSVTYVKGIWKNTGPTFRVFADGCLIYRDTVNSHDIGRLQIDLDRLGEVGVGKWDGNKSR